MKQLWSDREFVHMEGLYRAGLSAWQIIEIFKRRLEPIPCGIGHEIMALLYPKLVAYPGYSLGRDTHQEEVAKEMAETEEFPF